MVVKLGKLSSDSESSTDVFDNIILLEDETGFEFAISFSSLSTDSLGSVNGQHHVVMQVLTQLPLLRNDDPHSCCSCDKPRPLCNYIGELSVSRSHKKWCSSSV